MASYYTCLVNNTIVFNILAMHSYAFIFTLYTSQGRQEV